MTKQLVTLLFLTAFPGTAAFASDVSFPKTKYVVQENDGKDKEINANLIFTSDSIIVKDRKKSDVFASIPYEIVSDVVYERSTHARIKTAIILTPWALLSKGKKHWLTITYKDGESQNFVLLKLDKKEYKRILPVVETKTGIDVERIIED